MRYVESLNRSLHDMMSRDTRVHLIGEDLLDPYGGAFKVSKGLSTAFPDRVLTTPISEAGITGFANGMAIRGLRPIVEIMFGDFIALCADQIINGATKFNWMYNDQIRVPTVIRTPMGGRRGYGPTHSQTLERIFMGVTGLTIIAPSHCHKPGNLLEQAVLGLEDPVLFVENKKLYPEPLIEAGEDGWAGEYFVQNITRRDERFPTLRVNAAGPVEPDVVLIAYGGMAPMALEAAHDCFMEEEVVVDVVFPSLIKPFPIEDVEESIRECGKVLVTEEAPVSGGWSAEISSAVTEKYFRHLKGPVTRVGALEIPIPSSMPMEEQALPQVDDLKRAVYRLAEE